MDLKQFSDRTADGVRKYLGAQAGVCIREVQKNNGITLHGMTVTDKRSNLSPTIYMESFYEEYQAGRALGEIVRDIVKIYEDTRVKGKINMDFFTDYEKTRKRIFCKLIHYERNRNMLRDVPHKRYLDLAIVCYYSYVNEMVGSGTITIRKGQLESWKVTEEQLLREAMDNTERVLGYRWYDMKSMIREIARQCDRREEQMVDDMLENSSTSPMYVVTNRDKYFGAVCMVFEGVMRNMGEVIGEDFVILPSSIHESATR